MAFFVKYGLHKYDCSREEDTKGWAKNKNVDG